MKKKLVVLSDDRQERREAAEADFLNWVHLVQPKRLLGHVHEELANFWTRSEAGTHQLVLLPRDHMKSTMVALYAVWLLTKNPTMSILYISSTSNLATKQLKFMKDVLTSENYTLYWPEMVNREEAKREKWTEREISIDHPKRKEESIRFPSIFTAGLTTNIVGMHCDLAIMDDVVVAGNAYTEEGRNKVREQYGYLSSIESAEGRELVVGTRYHPLDLYADLRQMEVEEYDEIGNVKHATPLFEIFEREVESVGDGSGQFLWPRQQRSDGLWFGFDQKILSRKKSQYTNQIHFRAQYYNDPQDIDSSPIKRDLFQYYEQAYLGQVNGRWNFKGAPLNVFASIDFAYSLGKRADATSIVVIGVDGNQNYYVLDIDRFKTDQTSEYYKHIFLMFEKWGFRKIRAEVSVAQKVIVNELRENYIRKYGLSLVVEESRPSRWEGSKQERILAVLEPKYANGQVWHYRGGNCQLLEEELLFANPPHDDIKDALSSVLEMALAPKNIFRMIKQNIPNFSFNSKFGGVQ